MSGTRVASVGILTGWGAGTAALPPDAGAAASGRHVIPMPRPALDGERFRRATRECLAGIVAVETMLRDGGIGRDVLRGPGTALVYVTAAAYGASNRAFIEAGSASPARSGGGLTLHFPYTAPSAVPAEVAIEFGLAGPYAILIGGAAAAVDALWQATLLLERGRCERALVLAVETFAECADLYARGRWLAGRPLVEAAACALLTPGALRARYGAASSASRLETLARRRAGETFACAPLLALALAGDDRARGPVALTGAWRGRRAALTWAAS